MYKGEILNVPVWEGTEIAEQLKEVIAKASDYAKEHDLDANKIGEKYWNIPLNNPQYYGSSEGGFNAGGGECHTAFLRILKGGALPEEIAVFFDLYPNAMSEEIRWEQQTTALDYWKENGHPNVDVHAASGNPYDLQEVVGVAQMAGVFEGWRSLNLEKLNAALDGEKVSMLGKYYAKGVEDCDYYPIGG
jgi:hypothetical protein